MSPALLALIVLGGGVSHAHQDPAGCRVNNLTVDIKKPPVGEVVCGTQVPFTGSTANGTLTGACTVSAATVTLTCPNPATGTPTGPATVLDSGATFQVPSSKTYPPVNCTVGNTSGAVCVCGASSYVASVAASGTIHDNTTDDSVSISKTISVGCITTTTSTSTSISVTTSTSTSTSTLPDFQCYEVDRRSQGPVRGVQLDDAFGAGTVDVLKIKRLCNPANKNGDNPGAPAEPDHLVGYVIRQTSPFVLVRNQKIVNQFGTLTADALRPIKMLVPSAKSLTAPPPPPTSSQVGHFKCYKVSHTTGFTRIHGVTVQDQFGTLVVDIRKPVSLCVPANKNGEGIVNPTQHLMCYSVRGAASSPPFTRPGAVLIHDQFGPDSLTISHNDELCIPSLLNP